MRARPDLTARRHRYQGRSYWVVKDPVGLNYFRFQEEEYYILQQLDGRTSLDEIKRRFESQFPPQKITVEELQQFIGMLHKSGLIIANVPGQGRQLLKRRDERKRKELWGAMTNILSMRFKGIDPDKLLNWMLPIVKPAFTPFGVFVWAAVAIAAATLVTVQFDVFQSKLPSFHQFFNLQNAKWMMIVLAVTKILHEFGHGLSCKYFGGECHEMGVMLLVLTPCLYCNVSDSWMLPNKYHRAMIGAAGMYVEIFIASICTFVWWFSEPGLLNYLALSTMFVCSVSTVMFNGNPLLRYDGYYILSDLMEIPNLRQKSTSILTRKMGELCLGIEPPDDPFLPERNQWMFALYTVAAAVYRWFVVFSILFFLYKVFEPYGLKIIGQMIAMASLYGLIVQPLWNLGKFFYVPGRIEKVKKVRLFASLAVVSLVVAGILYVPVPHRVYATLEIKPRDAFPVHIAIPGILKDNPVKPGDVVQNDPADNTPEAIAADLPPKSTVLAQLENVDLELEISGLKGQLAEFEMRYLTLKAQQLNADRTIAKEASDQLPEVRKSIDATKELLATKLFDRRRLTVLAPASGVVLPAPSQQERPNEDGQLPSWSGSPMDKENVRAFLDTKTLYCFVGDPKKKEASLAIDQADRNFVEIGDTVFLKLDELPGETLEGTILDISSDKMEYAPKQNSNKAGGELATKTDEMGQERTMNPTYTAIVHLEDPNEIYQIGMRGEGRVEAGWMPLGKRLWLFVTQTFHFRL
jgi:putative peptide zinc metalloprotease protein